MSSTNHETAHHDYLPQKFKVNATPATHRSLLYAQTIRLTQHQTTVSTLQPFITTNPEVTVNSRYLLPMHVYAAAQ